MKNLKLTNIENYEGYYAGSDGYIYCDLGKGCRNKSVRVKPYRLTSRINNKTGYTRVTMRNSTSNKREDRYVHRLVAKYHVENPFNENVVNHKDFDKTNNHPSNLEWVTTKRNNEYNIECGRVARDELGRFKSTLV
ncbi:MAG: HNH endonuclease [Bacteroidales bacterium]